MHNAHHSLNIKLPAVSSHLFTTLLCYLKLACKLYFEQSLNVFLYFSLFYVVNSLCFTFYSFLLVDFCFWPFLLLWCTCLHDGLLRTIHKWKWPVPNFRDINKVLASFPKYIKKFLPDCNNFHLTLLPDFLFSPSKNRTRGWVSAFKLLLRFQV